MKRTRTVISRAAIVLTVPTLLGMVVPAAGSGAATHAGPTLIGRAVLPVETYAFGPDSGHFVQPADRHGIVFPLPGQPVEGFSAIVAGHGAGSFLAMADNGFGSKANSPDFLLRAYYIQPDFKTADGGSGNVSVDVRHPVSFRDPRGNIGFPIVNAGTTRRLLTGGDVDPESLQRGGARDLWVGDEFGPWILHFDDSGRLLHAPFPLPDGIVSPSNPSVTDPAAATQPDSRGLEGMAITPDHKYLYAALEGATIADRVAAPNRRHIFQFNTQRERFTQRRFEYRTEAPTNLIADMWALDSNRLVAIERDAGSGVNAIFRRVYLLDRRRIDSGGFLEKTQLIDLASIPDPRLISLPPRHDGDVGLGNPYRVTCESVEAIHFLGRGKFLIGCDNNFLNAGRNPTRADDSEFIVVRVPQPRSVR